MMKYFILLKIINNSHYFFKSNGFDVTFLKVTP